jgi:polyhydroxyalkanoate synthesis regulator phasin
VQKLALRAFELEEGIKAKEKSVSELKQRVDQLEGKLSEYSKRGVSDSMFRRLDRFSFGAEDELVARLDTAESYLGLRSEAERLQAELPGLRKSVSDLGGVKRELESEIIRLKGERDKERSKNYVQRESIRILGTFYKAGYKSEDIEGIKIGLDTLGVAGDPRTSVKVLIDLLGKEIKLGRLETNIVASMAELNEIKNDIDLAKSGSWRPPPKMASSG